MRNDVRFLEATFEEASNRICNRATDEKDVLAYIEALLSIVRNPELADVLRMTSEMLTRCCRSIESALANGSMDRQAGSLGTAVQLLIGISQE